MHPHVVTFGKSWIAVNTHSGCDINCAYCLLKAQQRIPTSPTRLATPQAAVRQLLRSPHFEEKRTRVAINIATEPFHKDVIGSTTRLLQCLDATGLSNRVAIVTKLHPGDRQLGMLTRVKHLKPLLVVSYSGAPYSVEPVQERARIELMREATRRGLQVLHYWRPIIRGINAASSVLGAMYERVASVSMCSVVSGLKHGENAMGKMEAADNSQRGALLTNGLTSRTRRVVRLLETHSANEHPVFFHTSCALSFLDGVSDYNLHYISEPWLCLHCRHRNVCHRNARRRIDAVVSADAVKGFITRCEPDNRAALRTSKRGILVCGKIARNTKMSLQHHFQKRVYVCNARRGT